MKDPQDFKDDYVHLWEYFEDRAELLKDRLWTMSTWLLAFNSTILGFIFGTQSIAFDSSGSGIGAPEFVLALALAGCALCLYALFLISDYGKHIQRNWDRAIVLKEKPPLVREVLARNSVTTTKRMRDSFTIILAKHSHHFGDTIMSREKKGRKLSATNL